MKSVIRPILACTVLGLAGAPASGLAASPPTPAPPGTSEGTGAPASTPHGFVQMIGEAIAQLTLRPDQEAEVEELSTEIEPLQAKVDAAENALLTALAGQVEAGRIDEGALEPLVSAYVDARLRVSPEIRRIVEDLHEVLDPDQRADFAEALQCVVHEVHQAIVSGERLDDFAKKLRLDLDQVARIQEGLKSIDPALRSQRALLHKILEAFRGEDFSVERVFPRSELSERARARAEQIIHLTASLLDVLDPAQRAPLAARIREAVRARTAASEAPGAEPSAQTGAQGERLGATVDPLWAAAGVRRGAFGGVRGGVVVGGAGRFAYGGVRAYPYAAGWGYGW